MLGRWLISLRYSVEQQRRAWVASNPARMKYEPGWLHRVFDTLRANPGRWVLRLAFVCLVCSIVFASAPPPYRGLFSLSPIQDSTYSAREVFVALWATQAAMVAVVYPIVVAFVTILLQRQSASKASLEAYFVGSGAKLTGISSLALVLVMALQFPFVDQVPPLSAFAVMLVDAVWFILNSALSIYFLVATFQFAAPDGRVRARNRYLLTRAWPQEWGFHLARQLWADPVGQKLMAATPAFETMGDAGPAFSARPGYFGTATAYCGTYRGARAVVDVRFRFLQWTFDLWARRHQGGAGVTSGRPEQGAAFERPGPVLELASGVLEPVYHREALLTCSQGAFLNGTERLLAWCAFALSSAPAQPRVTVLDGLEEAAAEALDAMSQDAEDEFNRRLTMLLELYDQLIESSSTRDEGKPSNWSLMGDTQDPVDSPLVRGWQRVFYNLHRRALSALDRNSFFARKTIVVPSRFFVRQRGFWVGELAQFSLELQFFHLRSTLDWGAEQCAASGGEREDGAVMNEPLRRRYEEVWRAGVGAWESIKNWLIESSEEDNWQALAVAAPLFEAHLRQSLQLVGTALDGNDARGTFWIADSLFQWVRQRRRAGYVEGVAAQDRFKVTYAHLLLPLAQFRQQFPLPPYEAESGETRQAAWYVALENLWADYLCTLMASILVFKAVSDQVRSLSLQLVRTALLATDTPRFRWSGGEPVFRNADELLSALVRQYAIAGGDLDSGYGDRLERVADAIAPDALASGVPGRMYGSTGMAFDSLLGGHLLMLVLLAPLGWTPAREFDTRIAQWADADTVRRRLLDFLRSAVTRLQQESFFTAMAANWETLSQTSRDDFKARLDGVRAALQDFISRVEQARAADVAAAVVSDASLQRISRYAASGLRAKLEDAPLALFPPVQFEQAPGQHPEATERRLFIQGWDKGTLTEPPLAQLASNEEEYIARVAVSAVSREVVRDILRQPALVRRGVATREQFEDAVRRFAAQARQSHERALLLVPARADPRWLLEMMRNSPDAALATLRYRREFAGVASYVGHIDETAVYVAALPSGQSLLVRGEMLQSVAVLGTPEHELRATAEPEASPERCTLKLSWLQRTSLGPQPIVLLVQSSGDVPENQPGAT